jgi:hypothetical protein
MRAADGIDANITDSPRSGAHHRRRLRVKSRVSIFD